MNLSAMLHEAGFKSGIVYATGLMKGHQVRSMAADFRAQETIGPMTERILQENGCYVENEKAAGQGDLIGIDLNKMIVFSIHSESIIDKEVAASYV